MFHRKQNNNRGNAGNNGPAIMMMPPHIRATFMPNPPVELKPPIKRSNKGIERKDNYEVDEDDSDEEMLIVSRSNVTGMSKYMSMFEERKTGPKRSKGMTNKIAKVSKAKSKENKNKEKIVPLKEEYRNHQKECSGEFDGMNCYNTLFVGRLAYETTERKLLREFEVFGPIKDLKLIFDKSSNQKTSCGFAFLEYEHEEDMKRAYRAADGMKLDGKEIVVDVERGHTVPNWLPRRLGGGLGGSRLGGVLQNATAPGRFDPTKPLIMPGPHPPHHPNMMPPQGGYRSSGAERPHGMNMPPRSNGHPFPPYGPPPSHHRSAPPPSRFGSGHPPPHIHPHQPWDRRMSDHYRPGRRNKRSRSRSPDRRRR